MTKSSRPSTSRTASPPWGLIDLESKEQQEIAEIDGDIKSLSVTKDDRWIYFVRLKAESDIWLATLE